MSAPVALVTGAGSGIGAAVVRQLTAATWTVVGLDLAPATADDLVGDVRDPADCRNAVDAVLRRHGRLDALVHAAGIEPQPAVKAALADHVEAGGSMQRRTTTLDLTDDEWSGLLHTNLDGAFNVVRPAGQAMVAAGGGAIVLVSSIAGVSGAVSLAGHYSAAKAGVIALTQALAGELVGHGVRVNAVAPGSVDTPMRDRNPEVLRHGMNLPMGRPASADEVASVVAFLIGPGAGYVTGETINVNGGALIT